MSAKRGLGRGFDSLIPTEILDESFDPTAEVDGQVSDLRHIKIEEVSADPNQPRRHFDEIALEELAASIERHGILQPLVVVPGRAGGYVIVAGERRYRAAKMAGLAKVPALVRTLSNQHKLEVSLIENLQRSDLNAIETAMAYLKLRDQFNMTNDAIGAHLGGRSPSSISNTMRLLKLPRVVKDAIAAGKFREGQARPLVNLDHELIEKVFPTMLKEDWSARRVEQFVVQCKTEGSEGAVKPIINKEKITPYKKELGLLEKRYKAPISIQSSAKGSGRIVIKFKNEDDFRRINELLQ